MPRGQAGDGRTFVVGAGIAGLACAVRLARRGRAVTVFEATDHGGGRCRSFFEPALERVINNGNHLVLSGNDALLAYLGEIGARETLACAPRAAFPFVDLASGERWTVRPNRGRVPWWILSPRRRAPGTGAGDYLGALRLRLKPAAATVAECFDTEKPIYARFWRPLAVAALNIAPEAGAARLLWPVVALTLGRGEAASRPCVPREGLSETFVAPALAFLESRGAPVRFGHRLRGLRTEGGRVTALEFAGARVEPGAGDDVVLALPPGPTAQLLPGVRAPGESQPIVNVHYRLARPAPPLPADSVLLGVVGGVAEWIFPHGDVVSVTVSAAGALADAEAPAIAARVWADVARALDLAPSEAAAVPPYRVIKERRATFAQTPAALSRRAPTRTALSNLYLAGDWTDTGLPATIEGAARSGHLAAAAVAAARGRGQAGLDIAPRPT